TQPCRLTAKSGLASGSRRGSTAPIGEQQRLTATVDAHFASRPYVRLAGDEAEGQPVAADERHHLDDVAHRDQLNAHRRSPAAKSDVDRVETHLLGQLNRRLIGKSDVKR